MNQRHNQLPWLIGGAAVLIILCCLCVVAAAAISPMFARRSGASETGVEVPTPRVIAPTPRAQSPQSTPRPALPPLEAGQDIETGIYTRVYERVNPSVVAVRVIDNDMIEENPDDIRPFFFNTGEGSGFVVDTLGHIITNRHVVNGAESIVVQFHDGILAPAQVLGVDRDTDLAVLKVDPAGLDLQPVVLGDLDDVDVGERVIVIGNPFGNTNTLTTGIISALGRQMALPGTDFLLPEVIQTDAAINPGNSGGPMLNAQGEVVAVAFMLQSETRSNSGIGFGIPVYFVERVSRAIIDKGEYRHAYLGIRGNGLSPFEIEALGLDVDYGILIADVLPDTPADRAGLQGGDETQTVEGAPFVIGGDIITAIDGQAIKVFDDLLAYLGRYTQPGDIVTFTIVRDGEELTVDIELEARPD